MKNMGFWIPLITWAAGAAAVTCILFGFHEVSPPVAAVYAAAVLGGFYVLWKRARK